MVGPISLGIIAVGTLAVLTKRAGREPTKPLAKSAPQPQDVYFHTPGQTRSESRHRRSSSRLWSNEKPSPGWIPYSIKAPPKRPAKYNCLVDSALKMVSQSSSNTH